MDNIIEPFSHIIIIGNGFDLNLGLKTGYYDFVKSNEFKSVVALGNDLCKYLEDKHNLNLWIDIENELKIYSADSNSETFESDYNSLCFALIQYLKNIDYSKINKASQAYCLLSKVSSQNFLILDFNYTNTVYDILSKTENPVSNIEDKLMKIHGSIKLDKIIFGVEDSVMLKPEHIFLKKSCNIEYKAIDFKSLLISAKEISFFGHSLGETDHMYFQEFFIESSYKTHGKKKFNLYYYGLESFKNLHVQLDKLTGQRVGFFKQNNDFNKIDVS